jgi:hypothetical protein
MSNESTYHHNVSKKQRNIDMSLSSLVRMSGWWLIWLFGKNPGEPGDAKASSAHAAWALLLTLCACPSVLDAASTQRRAARSPICPAMPTGSKQGTS